MEEQNFDGEAIRRLVAEIFRYCYLKLVCCHAVCPSREVKYLKEWEELAWSCAEETDGPPFEPRWTRGVLACQHIKGTLPNPNNVRGLIAYELSHTQELGTRLPPGKRCHLCGGEVDHAKREEFLSKIDRGFRLSDLAEPPDAEELIGTHLTEAQVFRLVGHEVNLSRMRKKARACYETLPDG